THARAHYIYADCMEEQGELNTAIAAYTTAIQYEHTEPLFYVRRGLAYAKSGRNEAAISDMSSAIQLNRTYAEAWYWRGMVKHRSGLMPCDDLNKARNLGLEAATEALTEICNTH